MCGTESQFAVCDECKRGEGFEEAARSYLATHSLDDLYSQSALNTLLWTYSRRDFLKPKPYVDAIGALDGLCVELYLAVAGYLGMVGGYDEARDVLAFARAQAEKGLPSLWDKGVEAQLADLDRAEEQNEKWRIRPYWPKRPEAQEQLSVIYAARGIACKKAESTVPAVSKSTPVVSAKASSGHGGYSGTGRWPRTIGRDEFCKPCRSYSVGDEFVAVWLREVPGKVKCACELVACRVDGGDVVDEYRSLVKPWKASGADQMQAAEVLGISLDELKAQREVFGVMPELMDFAKGSDIVLSSKAQLRLLVRALRYAGIGSLPNSVYLLDDCAEPDPLAQSAIEGISDVQIGAIEHWFPGLSEMAVADAVDFVAFDTETTGLAGWDRITEIGAVRVRSGKVVERFQMLANPGRPISQKVQGITGITDEMVADALPSCEVVARFKEFAGGDVLVGHNITFDLKMLGQSVGAPDAGFAGGYIDTLRMAKDLKARKGWECMKLGYLAEQLGVELVNAHRALADAEATAGIYLKMRELA